MCGMKVVVVASDESGNIDLEDLKAKALKYKDTLVRLRITEMERFQLIRHLFSCLSVQKYFFTSSLMYILSLRVISDFSHRNPLYVTFALSFHSTLLIPLFPS
jgi:hypothetical protein